MAPAMQEEYPEIAASTRLMKAFEEDKTLLQYQEGKDIRSFYVNKRCCLNNPKVQTHKRE